MIERPSAAEVASGESPERVEAIPITKPYFGDAELQAVQEPLLTGWVVQGPRVAEFERKFCAYTGAAHALAANSCTTALHLAVAALGLGPGDEVIVPAFTWVSTANVVEYMGATPVFCDVDLETYNLDIRHAESLVGERTVGILPVHLFGLAADMQAVGSLARRHSLWVVEDAACGFGAWYRGRHVGTFGAAGAFSFHPRKSITTGEGGMVTTQDAALAAAMTSLREHGASRSEHSRHSGEGAFLLADYEAVGFNYRMTDIQGALGSAQMDRADWILDRRRARAARYDELLADLQWLRSPSVPEDHVHGYQAYVCLYAIEEPSLENLPGLHERRNALMSRLENRGIATRQGTHAAGLVGYYRSRYELRPEDLPNAAIAESLTVALPLFAQMTDGEQDRVADELARGHEDL
ncbi:MAG TPA: DegT/DnrJ/EryC1/StrS family aminotransferase [Gaiellaceae bacterium]|nr:DegT/DnrJ/EryC1/StrS family aminotransferase [Gaiellaceae bacterium]